MSAGSDNKIFIWNVATAEIFTEISIHNDTIYSAVWNYNGSLILTSCKDKMLRLFDPRTGKLLKEGKGHTATKPMRTLFMKDGRIFTTGFSRTGERQYALYDGESLECLIMEELDNSNGLLFPFYDEDTNMIYLCGKGDSAIRYFEYTPESPYIHYLNTHQSSDPQRGMGWMTKRGLNVNNCEISKFYKLHNSGLCEVITMTVPRKSELFQEDLYPDTAAQQAAISAEEWFSGKDADPVMMSLKDVFLANQSQKEQKSGGSVLRQASRRIAEMGKPGQRDSANSEIQSASMSRLNMSSLRPPLSNPSNSNTPSHEPSPQPQGTNGTSTPASYTVIFFVI